MKTLFASLRAVAQSILAQQYDSNFCLSLETMEELYNQPISRERFEQYLSKLQGSTKTNVESSIMELNPMAKAHIYPKIAELKALDAEAIMTTAIQKVNANLKNDPSRIIKVALVLADDVGGAWTNRYTTDDVSKFQLTGLVKRNFCTPHFWTSENYTPEGITERTLVYIYRTLYWLQDSRPHSLQERDICLEKRRCIYQF